MIMRSSNHNTRQTSSVERKLDRAQRGKFKGLLTKASKGSRPGNVDKHTHTGHQHHAVDDSELPTHPHRRADYFLPNPRITESPESTPPKNKIWEGAYRNFLSLGKTNSPEGSDLSKSPDTKKSSFAIIPGTKRLVTQAPSHPAAPRTGAPNRKAGRTQSMSLLDTRNHPQGDVLETETRGAASFMKGVFNRSTSDGSVSVARRTRNYSTGSSPDDLDSAMRKGMNRNSPEYSHVTRKQASPPMFPPDPPRLPHVRASSQEDIPVGLDALLAGASISPHFTVETGGVPRASSYGIIHPISESIDNHSGQYPFYLPKRDSNGSFNYYQAGLCLEDDSQGNSSGSSDALLRSKAHDLSSRGTSQGHLHGSLLSQQVAAHAGTQLDQQSYHPSGSLEQQRYPQHVQFRHGYQEQSYPMESNGYRNGSAIQDISPPMTGGGLGSFGYHPNFVAGTPPSSIVAQQDRSSPSMVAIHPEVKKVFTTFHNQARFARDATSPFLGGEESPSPLQHDSFVTYHMMMGGGGISVPYQGNSNLS